MDKKTCLGVVLAGGQSLRMGQDKALLELDGQSLAVHAVCRLRHQLGPVIISAQKKQQALALAASAPVVPDLPSHSGLGPLGGILAAMGYAQAAGFQTIITVAVDTPFFPEDYAMRMIETCEENTPAPVMAVAGGVPQPTFTLWPVSLAHNLHRHLQAEKKKSILAFARRHAAKQAHFPAQGPFFNINTPDEFTCAQRMSARNKKEHMP